MIMVDENKGMRKILERPGSLIEGEKYLLFLRKNCRQEPTEEPVTFIGYTPCPATVIVLDRQQRRLYCEKGNLFMEGFEE
jgi:hypothetical protein